MNFYKRFRGASRNTTGPRNQVGFFLLHFGTAHIPLRHSFETTVTCFGQTLVQHVVEHAFQKSKVNWGCQEKEKKKKTQEKVYTGRWREIKRVWEVGGATDRSLLDGTPSPCQHALVTPLEWIWWVLIKERKYLWAFGEGRPESLPWLLWLVWVSGLTHGNEKLGNREQSQYWLCDSRMHIQPRKQTKQTDAQIHKVFKLLDALIWSMDIRMFVFDI